MSVRAGFFGQLTVSDTIGSSPLVRTLALAFSGTAQTYSQNQLIGSSPTSITLPISPAQFIYVCNLHATQTLTVIWTPNGGASATIIVLQPSALIVHVAPNTTSGITALSLQGSGANTNAEYIIAG